MESVAVYFTFSFKKELPDFLIVSAGEDKAENANPLLVTLINKQRMIKKDLLKIKRNFYC